MSWAAAIAHLLLGERMSAPREKNPRRLREALATVIYPIMGLGVIAIIAVGLRRSGWTFLGWLSDVVGIVWPLAFSCGLLFLLAAHASKKKKGLKEAYPFMRYAAL
jgi:hypothetical protein